MATAISIPQSLPPLSLMSERHYSVAELATMWNLSDDTIRRMFENEPDVQVVERPGRTSKRRFRTLRIPESVAQRVYVRQGLK
jgi:transcriptional regulator GlxA family with amidase domain